MIINHELSRISDIDECNNDLLVCDHEIELCRNTIGSYQCHCKPGYEYSTFGNCTRIMSFRSGASLTCSL